MTQLDIAWMLLCICLLMFMQLGFICLEAGLVRSKNSINVVMKNCLDFCTSVITFFFVGSAIMFAPISEFFSVIRANMSLEATDTLVILLFHSMFCATAVTIISGAVAERMSFRSYIYISFVTALVIYPLAGRLVWGDAMFGNPDLALLSTIGFYDFAGATVVHSVGGAVSLAAVLILGPRIGRFGDDHESIRPSSIPLASVGVFLMWVGWFGFNGGSELAFTEKTPSVLFVTLLSGIAGMASAAAVSRARHARFDVLPILFGSLAGLVAISAGASFYLPWQALIVGASAGVIPILVQPILNRLKIDDGVGVIPIHLVAGIWGTVLVGAFRPVAGLTERWQLVALQLSGTFMISFCAFIFALLLLFVANQIRSLRVSAAAETIGLNIWEHNASTAQIDLLRQMAVQAQTGQFQQRISVEPYTAESDIATFYNQVLDKFNLLQDDKEKALEETLWLAEHDAMTGLKNRRAMMQTLHREQERLHRSGNLSTLAIIDIDLFKSINDNYGHDVGDQAIIHFAKLMINATRKTDTAARIGGEEFVVLLPDTNLNQAITALEHFRISLAQSPLVIDSMTIPITASIGVAQLQHDRTFEESMKLADIALYQAKNKGRNRVEVA